MRIINELQNTSIPAPTNPNTIVRPGSLLLATDGANAGSIYMVIREKDPTDSNKFLWNLCNLSNTALVRTSQASRKLRHDNDVELWSIVFNFNINLKYMGHISDYSLVANTALAV